MVMTPNPDPAERPAVIVVDDDLEILTALRRVFRDEPFRVLATSDPFEAWSWIRTRPVDLIIADEFMPGVLGTELLEAARHHAPRCARAVLTGHPGTTIGSRAVQQEVDLILLKPWDDDALRSSVRKLLTGRDHRPTQGAPR